MKRKYWTQSELDYLRRIYPEMSNEEVAMWLHRSKRSVSSKANALGLYKTPEFYDKQMRKGQFVKGQVPFNKGIPQKYWMSPEGAKRSGRGHFPSGTPRDDNPNSRQNKPIGHETVDKDGYIYVITYKGRVPKHRHVWEQANGPIPPNHCVKFKDGDRTNCSLDNLYLVSRADNCRMVTASLTPEQRKARLEKAQKKRNESIRRDRLRLKWGLEPEGRLIKRIKT